MSRSPYHTRKTGFTDKQIECLRHLSEDEGDTQIAREMGISLSSVQSHIARIKDKLEVFSREEVISYAKEHYGDPVESEADTSIPLTETLPGPKYLQVRALYRELASHYHALCADEKKCSRCKSYAKYGVLYVTGSLVEHLSDIAPACNAAHIYALEDAKLIEIEKLTPYRHTITFAEYKPKENIA